MRKKIVKILVAGALLGLFVFWGWTRGGAALRESIFFPVKPFVKLADYMRVKLMPESGLAEENERLKAENFELETLREENASLKRVLQFRDEKHISMRAGRVFYYGRELGREYLLLDQGTDSGIRKGDLAVDKNGFFVGTVRDARSGDSRVEVASNPGETFEVEIVASSSVRVLANGIGNRASAIDLLPPDIATKSGTAVLLLGTAQGGGRYSIFFGEVSGIKKAAGSAFNEAKVLLLSHPDSLREIFIIESRSK